MDPGATRGATALIEALLADPRAFNNQGRANALLRTFYGGVAVESLRPLLRHADAGVVEAASFVASELGTAAIPLLDDLVHVMASGDRKSRFQALEAIALCAPVGRPSAYGIVVECLEDSDEVIRGLAMFLVARAKPTTVEAVSRVLLSSGKKSPWFALLTDERTAESDVLSALRSDNSLGRRYGTIAAARLHKRFPHLLERAEALEDEDVRRFLRKWHIAEDPSV